MTLRFRLFLLVAATLLPVAVAAMVAAALLLDHESEQLERDAIGRSRAVLSAVDAHLRASIAALETLAASKHLAAGDLRAFHAESQQVLRTQPAWVNIGLAGVDKVQHANAVYNFGKPEPFAQAVDEESFDAVVRTRRPVVGSIAAGTVVQRPTARVRVPVVLGGEVRYVLSAPLNLAHIGALLEAQHLPEGWSIGAVDREHRIIARIPPVPAGLPASDTIREATERAPEGWYHGRNLEGRPSYTAYVTSPMSGWTLGIGIPESAVEAETRILLSLLAAGVFAVALPRPAGGLADRAPAGLSAGVGRSASPAPRRPRRCPACRSPAPSPPCRPRPRRGRWASPRRACARSRR